MDKRAVAELVCAGHDLDEAMEPTGERDVRDTHVRNASDHVHHAIRILTGEDAQEPIMALRRMLGKQRDRLCALGLHDELDFASAAIWDLEIAVEAAKKAESVPTVAGPWMCFVDGEATELRLVVDEEIELPAPPAVHDEYVADFSPKPWGWS